MLANKFLQTDIPKVKKLFELLKNEILLTILLSCISPEANPKIKVLAQVVYFGKLPKKSQWEIGGKVG